MKMKRTSRPIAAPKERHLAFMPKISKRTVTLTFQRPRTLKEFAAICKKLMTNKVRIGLTIIVVVLFFTEIIPVWGPHIAAKSYALDDTASLLTPTSNALADKIKYDAQNQAYNFNSGYIPRNTGTEAAGGPRISAVAYSDPSKGVSVTDPTSDADFGLKPQFNLKAAQQQKNRIVYPLADGSGWLVYTLEAGQVKEDILLKQSTDNEKQYVYKLDLNDSLEAHAMPNGSIAVYGDTMLSGDVSTGTSKDAALLQKARKNAKKDKLMFIIPAPVIKEADTTKSNVKAKYELKGDMLTLKVTGLEKAKYPLTIDPSVYVTSAQQFMEGNNESNIDFDTTNNLIDKGSLTGARIPNWSNSLSLNTGLWNQSTAVGGGYIYAVGGSTGSSNVASVYWAKFDPTSKAIVSPTPGSTACTNWCTNAAYNLPLPRAGLSTVVYNGYLFAVGGTDASCGTNSACSTVYSAKIGANGEPIGWNATSSLTTGRKYTGIAAYNNHLYVVGGQTTNSATGDSSVEYASINPNGTLGTFTTNGMTALPAATWGQSVLQYNGYLYSIGGATSTVTTNATHYIKINTDGTLASSWVATTSFGTARANIGDNFATIWGGYMYIVGGCGVVNNNYSCTTREADMQLASINADGSLTNWTSQTTPLATALVGHSLVAWRNALYVVGGCSAMPTTSQTCATTQTATEYGKINSDGDVSRIFPSESSDYYTTYGSPAPAPIHDLPALGNTATTAGRTASGVVINNGWIYSIGGCANLACTTMSPNTVRATVNSDGTLGAWAIDSAHDIGTGLGAFGLTVYNNTIYAVGGSTGAAFSRAIYRVVLNADGSLASAWSNTSSTTSLATAYASPFAFSRATPGSGTTGSLYIIGGCSNANTNAAIGCTGYVATVLKCTIPNIGSTATAGAPTGCATTGQLQLSVGTGIFAGATYGKYIYLAGGANSTTSCVPATSCGGQTDLVQYAMVNSAGNITRTDGTTTTGGWQVTTAHLPVVRRRTVGFAANGYLYVIAGHNGADSANPVTLNDIVVGKINVNTGDINSFTTLATTITSRWDLRAAAANGYMYLIGGCTNGDPPGGCTNTGGTGMSGVGEYVQIYNNWSGSPASYTSSTNQPTTDRYGGSATVMNGYLYYAGGCTSTATDCSNSTTATMTNDVTYAKLNPDGSIGAWVTSSTYNLPAALGMGRLENVGNTLYYIGGQTGNGTSQTSVYYNTANATTGEPGAWALATDGLPAARSRLNTSVYNGRIYAVGGSTGVGTTADTNTVFYSPNLSAGGNITSAWTQNATSFSLPRSGLSTVAYGNNLYVIGGFDGTNYLLDVQYAPIHADGSVGAWNFGASLPQAVRQGDAFATNGFIYVFGGRSSGAVGACTSNTYDIPVNADGSLGTGWSQTSVTYSGTRYGVAAAYDSGRAYLLGGGCVNSGTAVTLTKPTNNSAIYGTLQIQPQVANYSLMIDTDTDVFPSKYLINGLDNGIGAAWYLSYQSSTAAAASWGILNNTGKLALGVPGTYTPYDANGVNTNTTVGARYFMLYLKIDDQQAFGFPEDVSRGPNIYDLTLQFASDPGKRLRNGKTFTGGQQQPLDTPF